MQRETGRKRKFLSIAALILCSAVTCADALQIREGYVREMPPGQSTSAAFMKIANETNRPVAIVAATCDAAQTTELHTHRRVDGGVRMELVRRLVIPAKGQVELVSGGYHLMLINLKRSLHAGESVNVTLFDEEGKLYSARLPVVKMLGAVQ
jgi:copper(I)-binding protein